MCSLSNIKNIQKIYKERYKWWNIGKNRSFEYTFTPAEIISEIKKFITTEHYKMTRFYSIYYKINYFFNLIKYFLCLSVLLWIS